MHYIYIMYCCHENELFLPTIFSRSCHWQLAFIAVILSLSVLLLILRLFRNDTRFEENINVHYACDELSYVCR